VCVSVSPLACVSASPLACTFWGFFIVRERECVCVCTCTYAHCRLLHLLSLFHAYVSTHTHTHTHQQLCRTGVMQSVYGEGADARRLGRVVGGVWVRKRRKLRGHLRGARGGEGRGDGVGVGVRECACACAYICACAYTCASAWTCAGVCVRVWVGVLEQVSMGVGGCG
jgi:hypothetical protein